MEGMSEQEGKTFEDLPFHLLALFLARHPEMIFHTLKSLSPTWEQGLHLSCCPLWPQPTLGIQMSVGDLWRRTGKILPGKADLLYSFMYCTSQATKLGRRLSRYICLSHVRLRTIPGLLPRSLPPQSLAMFSVYFSSTFPHALLWVTNCDYFWQSLSLLPATPASPSELQPATAANCGVL